jgi:Short C-terminal domain
LLTLLAFGFAVWLASERRKTVRGVGIILAVVGVVGLISSRFTENYLVDSLVAHKDDRQAASNAWDILTDLMRGSFRVLIVVGVLFVVASWLAGPGRRARATRRWVAPGLRDRVWAYVGLGIVALVLLLTGQVTDFARFVFVALVVALGATWIELTRRQTLHEFPSIDGPALVADARSRLSDWWDARRVAAAGPKGGAPVADVAASLATLADLHARGELTDAEYASAKARILGA